MKPELIKHANLISEKLREKTELKTQQEQLEGFTKRSKTLQTLSVDAEKLNRSMKILKEKGETNVDVHGNVFFKIKEETKELNANYQRNPSDILDVGDSFFNRWRSSLVSIEELVKQSWKKYKENNITSINYSLLSILKAFPDFIQTINLIEQRKSFLDSLLNKIPESKEDWEILEQANKNLNEIWETVPFHSLPENVGSFLKKAQGGNAVLNDLTPEVKDWLEEKKLMKYFKIRISNN